MAAKLRVGVSACLLGQEVRWDGRHKRDAALLGALGPLVEWVPVCPEVELGLGVPREPIRLTGLPAAPRLVGDRSLADHTEAMAAYARRRAAELSALQLDGYVTKRGSPSCGLAGVPVHPAPGAAGEARPEGVGAFVRALREALPGLPIEEEEALHDPARRAEFVERLSQRAGRGR
ncbi:MAG TPA: DUF523 domain-containing protein [Anaeromyxobacteraceae bacterium]|nr:DUF523 domain-containing protein [Anaeromyxobacteraceae bacterium]